MSRKLRITASALLGGFFLVSVFIWQASANNLASPGAAAKAHIAIQYDTGDTNIRQISFTAPISGLAALQQTGIPVVTYDNGSGAAVCSINGVGCPEDQCFTCSDYFWENDYWDGHAWQMYGVGSDQTSLTDGAVDGWRWVKWGDAVGIPPAPQLLAAQSALDWLASQQSPTDGGYGSVSSSVESLLSIGANGLSAADWRLEPPLASPTLMDFFKWKGGRYSGLGADSSGKLVTGLTAAGACWPFGTNFPGQYYNDANGHYAEGAGPQSWAVLGVAALGDAIPALATQYLKDLQQSNGAWEWGEGFGTDTNTTALVIQALITAGELPSSTPVVDGLQYLQDAQNSDGGIPYDPDGIWGFGQDSDANSTAYGIQAIYAADQNPASWIISGNNPVSFLLSLQLSDGSIELKPGNGANLMATQQAVPALLGRPSPYNHLNFNFCPMYLPLISK